MNDFHPIFGEEFMDKQRAAIFGATSALSHAVAINLIETGVCTYFYLIARNTEKLDLVAKDLTVRGGEVQTLVCDLDDIAAHQELVDSVSDANSFWYFFGSLPDQCRAEQCWDLAEAAIKTNFLSCASLLTRVAKMQEEKQEESSLIVVSSVAGDRGRKSNYIYGTAKGALSLFCQGLRNRYDSSGIHVLTVKPGFIDTPMTETMAKKPAFLWATPEQVAVLIVQAFKRKKDIVYTPWFWRYILLIIMVIPESIFKRMSL